jgi:hypothetical protein
MCARTTVWHWDQRLASSSICHRVGGGRHFADSGVVVWHGRPWSAIFDVGEIGPAYQPGHAHADTLTSECSFNGVRLLVDPGCFHYDHDDSRRYDRSTAAHNTVCVDDTDSSEVWHIFRVGRRARPREVDVSIKGASLEATASHTGYDHLPGRPRHTRRLTVGDDAGLTIVDRLEGRGNHKASGGWLLAPEWKAVPTSRGWLLSNRKDRLSVTVNGPERMRLSFERRPIHADFGVVAQSHRLQWSYEGVFPIEVRMQAERG